MQELSAKIDSGQILTDGIQFVAKYILQWF